TPPTSSSPATPIGTGRPCASTMYTRTFASGRPIGNRSLPSHTSVVAHTVASVGPYAFTTRRPAPQRRATSTPHASPATTTVRSAGSGASGSVASTDGGSVTTSIASSRSTSPSAAPTSGSRVARRNVPPFNSVTHSS